MRVLYTSDIFDRQRVGGISRYFAELFIELAGLDADFVVETGRGRNAHLTEALAAVPVLRARSVGRARYPRQGGGVPGRRGPAPLVHRTYYPLRETVPGARLVTTVHDLVDERFGGSLAARLRARLKRGAALRARRIVAVSETTKRDIVERWGVDERRIRVIHHGVRLPGTDAGGASRRPVSGPFVLFVGRRGGYKNFGRLVEACGRLAARGVDPFLVAAGGGLLSADERRHVARCGLAHRVVQMPVGDGELVSLYRGASALVCPSLYEGFGLPVLEAMASGCCVCCSSAGSLPEVAGEAAEYFDPAEPDAIAEALERVLSDRTRRAGLVAAGRARASRFTWRASAGRHVALYRELAEEGAEPWALR